MFYTYLTCKSLSKKREIPLREEGLSGCLAAVPVPNVEWKSGFWPEVDIFLVREKPVLICYGHCAFSSGKSIFSLISLLIVLRRFCFPLFASFPQENSFSLGKGRVLERECTWKSKHF